MSEWINGTIYAPQHIAAIREMALLFDISEKYASDLNDQVERMDNNLLIETSDEEAIARREEIYGITADGRPLDERRFRLLVESSPPTAYTGQYLREYLNYLLGEDQYQLTVDHETLSLTLKLTLSSKANQFIVQEFIERIAPLHISVTVGLLYNRWEILGKTWGELAEDTWIRWKNEVL